MGNICFAVIPVALGYFGAGTEDMIVFLMLSSSLLGSLSILVLSYLFSEEIGELSCTCYFSARQIAAQQMLGLGAVNLLTLGFLICFIGGSLESRTFPDWDLHAGSFCSYSGYLYGYFCSLKD